ncbi:MAG TPA: DNA repair ATPase, partial [Sedimentisphaerales bacterium]|nr:DNA repair ATPase [Sedimentisphaerales bacterium]
METNATDKRDGAPPVADENVPRPKDQGQIQNGTYEILRGRLTAHCKELRSRLEKLNKARKEIFGGIDTRLLSSQRISTANKCVPRDMVTVGDRFIFGYNVFVGLRAQTSLEDVFAIYQWKGGSFSPCPLDAIRDPQFESDFKNLYRYYRRTV